MADINQVITLGIGTPAGIPEFLTFGLQLGIPATVPTSKGLAGSGSTGIGLHGNQSTGNGIMSNQSTGSGISGSGSL